MTESVIIRRPDMQPVGMRWVYGALTTVLWALWLYLIAPLVSLVAWLMGLRLLIVEVLLPADTAFGRDALIYGLVAIGILSLVVGWSLYNGYRFRSLQRRQAPAAVTSYDEAADYAVPEDMVARLKQARRAVVAHDAQGQPRLQES